MPARDVLLGSGVVPGKGERGTETRAGEGRCGPGARRRPPRRVDKRPVLVDAVRGVRRRHHQHSVDSLQGAPQGIGVPNGPGAAVAPGGGGPRAGSRTTSVWDLLLQPVGGPRCGRRGFRWLRSLLSRGRTRVSVANHHILFESSGICVIPRRRVKATPRRSFWQKMTAASFTASSSNAFASSLVRPQGNYLARP